MTIGFYQTRLRFGFKSRNQLPLFMLWREYLYGEEVIYAKVLFVIETNLHIAFSGKIGAKS